jgi:transcription elongation GreA/GreB family factor
VESPVGRAIVGRRRGDVVVVEAPRGQIRVRIVGIEATAAGKPDVHRSATTQR